MVTTTAGKTHTASGSTTAGCKSTSLKPLSQKTQVVCFSELYVLTRRGAETTASKRSGKKRFHLLSLSSTSTMFSPLVMINVISHDALGNSLKGFCFCYCWCASMTCQTNFNPNSTSSNHISATFMNLLSFFLRSCSCFVGICMHLWELWNKYLHVSALPLGTVCLNCHLSRMASNLFHGVMLLNRKPGA